MPDVELTYAVEMRHVTKQFPQVIANDDITFRVQKGEILEM